MGLLHLSSAFKQPPFARVIYVFPSDTAEYIPWLYSDDSLPCLFD